jgi:hypothetical protein
MDVEICAVARGGKKVLQLYSPALEASERSVVILHFKL